MIKALTVKPLLYVIGALLLVIAGQAVWLSMRGADMRAAEAETGRMEAQRDAARTERDAWKLSAESNGKASQAANAAVDGLAQTVEDVQAECRRQGEANAAAIERARAEARDADRTLQTFTAKFQTESRKPACAQALARLEDACPALRDY